MQLPSNSSCAASEPAAATTLATAFLFARESDLEIHGGEAPVPTPPKPRL